MAKQPTGLNSRSLAALALLGHGDATGRGNKLGVSGGGAGSMLDGLKNLGSDALKALSVPQAALFTATAKAAGKPISWKNAEGDFYTNAQGEHGSTNALKALGINNKWARLGTEIVVDPLWGLGAVKLAKAGTTAAKALEGGEAALSGARAAPKLLGSGENRAIRALIGAGDDTGKNLPDVIRAEPVPTLDTVEVKGRHYVKMKRGASPEGREGRSLVQSEPPANWWRTLPHKGPVLHGPAKKEEFRALGLDEGLGLVDDPTNWQLYRSRVKTPSSSIKVKNVASGALVEDRYFIVKLNRTNKADYRKFGVYILKNPGEWQASDARFAQTFSHQADAVNFAREQAARSKAADAGLGAVARRGGTEVGPYTGKPPTIEDATWKEVPGPGVASEPPRATTAATEAAGGPVPPSFAKGPVEGQKLGNPLDLPGLQEFLTGARRKWMRDVEGGGKLGIKLGVGKHAPEGGKGLSGLNYTIPTGVNLPTKSLAALSDGSKVKQMFVKEPIEKVAHRQFDALHSMTGDIPRQLAEQKKAWASIGKTPGDAALTYLVAALDNASINGVAKAEHLANGGEGLKAYLQASGRWDAANDRMLNVFRDRFAQMGQLEGRGVRPHVGPYVPQGVANETLVAQREAAKAAGRPQGLFGAPNVSSILNPNKAREYGSPFAYTTPDQFVKDLVKKYGIDQHTAEDVTHLIHEHTGRVDEFLASKLGKSAEDLKAFQGKTGDFKQYGFASEHSSSPELDFFDLAARREEGHYRVMIEKQIHDLVNESGIADDLKDAAVTRLLGKDKVNLAAVPGTLSESKVGRVLEKVMPKYKALLTTVNLSHYTFNWLGDSANRMIEGGFRHLATPGGSLGVAGKAGKKARLGGRSIKLATGDREALMKTYKLFGRDWTGEQVLAMSHMAGLGRGYVGADIMAFIKADEATRNPLKQYYRFMQRQNQTREDAQRIDTWFKFMQDGLDPLAAQAKTLRVHFDYADLTDFEKRVVRNMLMFYTWMKKNFALQWTSLVTRPAYAGTLQDFNRNREVYPNEPDFYKTQFAIPTPFGNITWGSPAADLYKADLGQITKTFRQNILGALAPPLKAPIEMATNTDLFTGGKLEKYQGQKVPSSLGLIPGLGTPTHTPDGETVMGVPWQAAYAWKQLGPPTSVLNSATAPDSAASFNANPAASLLRLIGPRPQINDQKKFAKAVKVHEAKVKADRTRATNAQR